MLDPDEVAAAEAEGEADVRLASRDEAVPGTLTRVGPVARFLAEARRHPRLSEAEEADLAARAQAGDATAAQTLVLHNLRLVASVAFRYHRTGTQLTDLIQEGTIGLIEAVRRWEASLGARFGTYATYWIRAYILHYIMTNARLVSIAGTRAGRKLFFRLERERQRLLSEGFEPTPRLLAARLDVGEQDVAELSGHLETPEVSIDAPGPDHGLPPADALTDPQPSIEELTAEGDFRRVLTGLIQDFGRRLEDERERAIWREHLTADEPVSLSALADRYGVSKQRVGQLATRLKTRFRAELLERFGTDSRIRWLQGRG